MSNTDTDIERVTEALINEPMVWDSMRTTMGATGMSGTASGFIYAYQRHGDDIVPTATLLVAEMCVSGSRRKKHTTIQGDYMPTTEQRRELVQRLLREIQR
jgi:IS4 transposase